MKTASLSLSRTFLGLAIGALFLAPCQTACSPRADSQTEPVVEQDRFVQMDTNGDGKIVIEEFRQAFPNMNDQAFVLIDRNNDKGIDRIEWAEFIDNHGKSRPMRDGASQMNNMPGDPLIPPVDSSDLPLMRPPAQ